MTPEETVKAAVRDALHNEYEDIVIQGWVDEAFFEYDEEVESR